MGIASAMIYCTKAKGTLAVPFLSSKKFNVCHPPESSTHVFALPLVQIYYLIKEQEDLLNYMVLFLNMQFAHFLKGAYQFLRFVFWGMGLKLMHSTLDKGV